MNKKNILVGQSMDRPRLSTGAFTVLSAKVRATAMRLAASTV